MNAGTKPVSADRYAHIELTPEGVPILSGTRTKVIEVALDRIAHHWDADEIQRQHPYLTLGQIHSALAYYYDHQDELDRDIERRMRRVQEIKSRTKEPSIELKLKQLGKIP
jgi:uncharacterized protein (DUF433 family)